MTIYKITNNITDKVYIGQTLRAVKERWIEHCKPSSNSCPLLNLAIKKHGKKNFTIEVIDKADNIEELNKKETYWIDYFKSTGKNGYNLSLGGRGNAVPMNDIQKNKLSSKIKKKWQNNEYRDKILSTWTSERKQKASDRMKGRKVSESTKEKLRQYTGSKNSRYGAILSLETRNKISTSQKGKKRNQKFAVKPIFCVETGVKYPSITECALDMGVNMKGISKVLRGTRPHYKGFSFKYL